MDPDLQKLVVSLRNETCPPGVLDRVADQIGRSRSDSRRVRPRFSWAMVLLALGLALGGWRWRVHREELAARERARILDQTHAALSLVGHSLFTAANHAEEAFIKKAVPPLRNGLETAKNKIRNQI